MIRGSMKLTKCVLSKAQKGFPNATREAIVYMAEMAAVFQASEKKSAWSEVSDMRRAVKVIVRTRG
jgi:hypothetical protein